MPSSACSMTLSRLDAGAEYDFATETELVKLFRHEFEGSAESSWKWLHEFPTATGIADLLTFELTPDWHEHVALGRIAPRWAYALHSLPCEPFTLEAFAILTNASLSCAKAVMRQFQDAGYCESGPGQQWRKVKEPQRIALRIVAIEAKLRNWRRALYQASQHSDFASSSWVVLDRGALRSASSKRHEFHMRGVGLAGMSAQGEIEVVVPALEKNARMPQRLWQANAEICQRLTS